LRRKTYLAIFFLILTWLVVPVLGLQSSSLNISSEGVVRYPSEIVGNGYIGAMWYGFNADEMRNSSIDFERYYEMAKQLGVKVYQEWVYPLFGIYYVPGDTFLIWGRPFTKAMVKEFIALAHSKGGIVLAYVNPCECQHNIAETGVYGGYNIGTNYTDSIFYNKGHAVRGYWQTDPDGQTYVMDPDPNKSYGRHTLQDIVGILDDWGFDGVKVDRLDYDGYIHDPDTGEWISPNPDNPTPLSSSLQSWLAAARDIVHQRGKILLGNAPRSNRTTQYLDMVSGDHTSLDTGDMTGYVGWQWYEFYHHITRQGVPIWVLWNTELNRTNIEQYLKWCLEGAVLPWTIGNGIRVEQTYNNKDLFEYYLPLIVEKMTK